jgi:hypothetical protein
MNQPNNNKHILLKPKPKWMGRLGNNITQLIYMLSLGKFQNKFVLIRENKKYQIKSEIINYTINDTKKIEYQEEYILNPFFLSHTKFFRNNITYTHKKQIIYDVIKILNLEKHYDTFENLFTDDLQKEYLIDQTALYIHIRSTDVYANHPNTIVYSQPPLSFYLKVIEDNNFNNIYILSDDNNSFIIQSLKNILKEKCHIIAEKNPTRALNILRRCKNICTSTSSFCTTPIFLSPSNIVKNVYTYSYLTNIFHHWFLSDLFHTENIYNNTIENIKFNIYQINKYKFMDNCFINDNLYTNIDNSLWWKNGNKDFQFNWKFDDDAKNIMLNHNIKDVVKIL